MLESSIVKKNDRKNLKAVWVVGGIVMLSMMACYTIAFMFGGLTTSNSNLNDAKNGSSPRQHNATIDRQSRTAARHKAESFRQEMLEKEASLKKKYAAKKDSRSDSSKDRTHAYKKWRDEKDMTKEAISKFKNYNPRDKRAVGHQMKKHLETVESDPGDRS